VPKIVQHVEKIFELGTQFPHDILTGDFTSRASSETTENIVMKKVRGYQRYLANKLQVELFDPILIQNGYDPKEVDLEIGFTTQNIIEVELDQMLAIANSKKISNSEYREWLRSNTGMELPDDDKIEQDDEEQKDLQIKQLDKKDKEVDDLEKKVERLIIEHNLEKENIRLKERMEQKLSLIKKANKEEREDLAQKRITALEKIIEKVEKLG